MPETPNQEARDAYWQGQRDRYRVSGLFASEIYRTAIQHHSERVRASEAAAAQEMRNLINHFMDAFARDLQDARRLSIDGSIIFDIRSRTLALHATGVVLNDGEDWFRNWQAIVNGLEGVLIQRSAIRSGGK